MSAIAAKQVVGASPGSAASATTAGITTASGSLLVAFVVSFTSGKIGATPITDSKGNTWTQGIAPFGTTNGFGAMYYCPNCTGGSGHTFTFTPTANDFIAIQVWEIVNAATASPLNSTSTSSASATTHQSGNITSNASVPEIFIGGVSLMHGSETTTPPTMSSLYWQTSRAVTQGSGGSGAVASGVRVVDPSTTDQFSITTGTSAFNEATMIAGFKAASGGGGGGGTEIAYTFIG